MFLSKIDLILFSKKIWFLLNELFKFTNQNHENY